MLALLVHEQRLVIERPQRLVDMRGVARHAIVPLRHEGDGLADVIGNFLGAVLDDRVAVCHFKGLGVADVDLFLAWAPFTLGVLDWNAGTGEAVSQGTHVNLFLGGLEDVIILDVVTRRLEVAIALLVRCLIAVIEQEELELGGHVGLHLHLLEALQLLLQDGARRMRYVLMAVVVKHVAQHQCSTGQPRRAAQRCHVGLQHEVAIALFPAGRLVAGHRLHLDVDAEQIVAAMRLLIAAVGEELGVEALADETALQVDHGGDYRVNRSGLHLCLQLFECQHAFGHRHSPSHLSISLRPGSAARTGAGPIHPGRARWRPDHS